MNIKRYCISWHDWDVVVEIDHDVMTDEKLHEINNFWSGAEDRLDDAKGNIVEAVLYQLAARCFQLQIEYGFTTKGMIGLFSWTDPHGLGPQEGWPNMDGSDGITIIGVEQITFDPEEMRLQVLP